jgi:hypothetical protein
MPDAAPFHEVYSRSLNRQGEELCGDQVKVIRTPVKTIVVLSDGLGSGVKANILSQLTTAIIVTMVRAEASLQDVIETVIGTLPICRVRKIAYATFIILEIERRTGRFKVINFDSPAALWLKQGQLQHLSRRTERLQGKTLEISEGQLDRGDFIGLISDGVTYAGMGVVLNFGWGWDQIGACLEQAARAPIQSAEALVHAVMQETGSLYGGQPGDDATMAGVLVREASRLMMFTGPPARRQEDGTWVRRLLEFEGRKVVCGGTTGNIVARHVGTEVETDLSTLREDLPPVGRLPGVDLLTEGILTLAKTVQLLRESRGQIGHLPPERTGASLLTRELLQADSISILAGDTINPLYQNPLLPKSVSIRRTLLDQVADLLGSYHKEVKIEWC